MSEQTIDVQATNYCSHAIDDIRRSVKVMRNARIMAQTAQRATVIAEMLQNAVKFMLPNCAQLVDEESLRESHLEMFRLPYPVVAFEASWITDKAVENELNGFQQSRSTRRIALCWELDENFEPFPGINEIGEYFPEGGVFVYPISYIDKLRAWEFGAGGTFVPRDFRIHENFETLPASEIAYSALREVGRMNEKGYRFRAEPFMLMPELFGEMVVRAGGDQEKAVAQIQLDSRDEVTMAVQACSVLNCANVETVNISPSRASNAKRAAKGKP
ncbi:hypothetical protein WJ32_01445 [Burkholderia ubonensis]|nr:hypothetical protein [Burkholderia ubonensis]AOJ61251.1 hypothetical protein WJ32_01445 [Burkholderia ubonensis]